MFACFLGFDIPTSSFTFIENVFYYIYIIIFIYVYGGSKRISGTSEVQHIDFQMEINDDLLLSDGQTLAECKNADLTQYVR